MMVLRVIPKQGLKEEYPVHPQYCMNDLDQTINFAIDTHAMFTFETADGRTVAIDPDRCASISCFDDQVLPDSYQG